MPQDKIQFDYSQHLPQLAKLPTETRIGNDPTVRQEVEGKIQSHANKAVQFNPSLQLGELRQVVKPGNVLNKVLSLSKPTSPYQARKLLAKDINDSMSKINLDRKFKGEETWSKDAIDNFNKLVYKLGSLEDNPARKYAFKYDKADKRYVADTIKLKASPELLNEVLNMIDSAKALPIITHNSEIDQTQWRGFREVFNQVKRYNEIYNHNDQLSSESSKPIDLVKIMDTGKAERGNVFGFEGDKILLNGRVISEYLLDQDEKFQIDNARQTLENIEKSQNTKEIDSLINPLKKSPEIELTYDNTNILIINGQQITEELKENLPSKLVDLMDAFQNSGTESMKVKNNFKWD